MELRRTGRDGPAERRSPGDEKRGTVRGAGHGIIRGMVRSDFLARHKLKIAVALGLTFGAGVVDAADYLGIYHLFAAQLSGTMVHFGLGVVTGPAGDVIAAGAIAAAWFLGGVFSRLIVRVGCELRFRNVAAAALAVEGGVIAAVAISTLFGAKQAYIDLALLAFAMGMQNGTLAQVGPLTVHTTFITGMINKLAQLAARMLFRSYNFFRGRDDTEESRAEHSAESQHAIFMLSIWMCYVLGAIGGAASYLQWGMRALFVAVGVIGTGIVADVFAPLSVEEELSKP